MLKRFLLISIIGWLHSMAQAETIHVHDNGEVTLHLSQTNYNRLSIRGDTLLDFAYPEGALALKRDSVDGSVYLITASQEPFTLFLTTEKGRHLTVTVTGEIALGKTIELVHQERIKNPATSIAKDKPHSLMKDNEAALVQQLLQAMQTHQRLPGMQVTRQFGQARRGNQLTLLPRERWDMVGFQGEIMELYNNSRQSLHLNTAWFQEPTVMALQLSKSRLNPHEHAFLYRVKRGHHG